MGTGTRARGRFVYRVALSAARTIAKMTVIAEEPFVRWYLVRARAFAR